MKLNETIEKLGLKVYTPSPADPEIAGGYTSDMLSDVIAGAGRDFVWVTIQTHANVIAVAALKDIAAILLARGHVPADETLELAKAKGVCVLGTRHSAFTITGKLYETGIRGGTDE